MDCLQLGRNRRKRIVCPFPGRKRRCRSSDRRSGYLFLRAEMVGRQQEATLGRWVAAVALCRCCEQDRNASRSGQIWRDRNFQLVAGQPMDRVGRPEENGMPRVYLYSLASKQQTAVTDNWYGSGEPVFSDDGKYLLLSSARGMEPDLFRMLAANARLFLFTDDERH